MRNGAAELRDDITRIGGELGDKIDLELADIWGAAKKRYLLDPRCVIDPDQLVARLGAM